MRPGALAFRLRTAAREGWARLRGGELTRSRAAASIALGLFVGALPLFGVQALILLAVALPLRLDFAVAYLAAQISNPLFAPAMVVGEVEIGARLWTGHYVAFSAEDLRRAGMTSVAGYAALGSIVLGAALAMVGAAATYALFALRAPKDALGRAVLATAARYRGLGRPAYWYVRAKLARDPVGSALASQGEPFGAIVDLGSGRGQLVLFLFAMGLASRARGIEWDPRKVGLARAAAAEHPAAAASFEVGDVREADLGEPDTVLLVDVLHYLAPPEQDALLVRAARAVRPGGSVIVREADADGGLRARITRLEERVLTALGWNRGEQVAMRPVVELVAVLERAGLACERSPASRGTPFSNVLVVARKPRIQG